MAEVPYQLLFDGSCALCRRSVALVRRLDWRRRVDAVDVAADWEAVARRFPDLDRRTVLEEIHVVTPRGALLGGFAACRALAWALPPAWPCVPVLYLPGARLAGAAIYRAVARRRVRVHPSAHGPGNSGAHPS
jgi:predicted DCC family thiol-disulfide oxidoreductase YuxK